MAGGSDMGHKSGGSGGSTNTPNREFLIKGDQVFDAQNPNQALGTIRNSQGGTNSGGGFGGASGNTGSGGTVNSSNR